MKTKVLAFAVATALSVASFSANAALEDSWTFGVKGGWAHSYIDSKDDVKVSDKNAFGYGAYVGYNFTDWFGIEVAYNGFSNFKINDGNGSHKLKIYGPEVATRFAYPLDENGSDIFARIGIAYHTDHLSNSNHGADAWDPLLGIGIQYAFTRNFAARAGYDYYFNSFDSDYKPESKVDGGMGFLYVGFQYTIGGPAPVVAPVVAPVTKKTERITENHNLSAGTLFPFDGSTLSANGKKVISDVVNSSKELSNTEFEVYGYTDRIGSDAYNKNLSEKRANAVANELKANGLTNNQIKAVEGRGKSNPVTGNKCDAVKGRNAVIDCLAPDRRVEVVVSGDKTYEKQI